MQDQPIVRFHSLAAGAKLPRRADRSAGGTLPTRAARYCDAVTGASAFGWHAFAPLDFALLWDGADIFWRFGAVPHWLPLETAQYPHMAAAFDAAAPADVRGCAPPFLTALAEPGAVQVWTGLIARTAPEWSLLVRAPANLPAPGGYALYEGIVESDRWFGPLFTNLRLTRTDAPVRFRADIPLVQLQPLPRAAYAEATLDAMECTESPARLDAADWEDYRRTVVRPSADPARPPGAFAIAARRRRRSECPHAASA